MEKDFQISGRLSVMLKPLDAFESLQADEYIGNSVSRQKATKIYAICSIRKIKGPGDKDFVSVNPLKNELEFAAVAKRFDALEIIKLMDVAEEYTVSLIDDALKNEYTAAPSSS